MSYRNGTYIAFHAQGSTDPTASDIRYYRMMKAWHENENIDFKFINSHEKAAAVRDSSTRATLARSLRLRLDNSKNLVLIVGPTTWKDTDWVPYEIQYAIDTCGIPIIAAYTQYSTVVAPSALSHLWPTALETRIQDGTARVLHIPFQRRMLDAAIRRFHLNNRPPDGLSHYTAEAHRQFGVSV